MKGKECVAIACDKRYGVQNKTIATNFTKIFQYSEHCFVSFCGLATDVSVSAGQWNRRECILVSRFKPYRSD
jgi:20S proteasome alpha/beta subunit